jgi:hypothetical protein
MKSYSQISLGAAVAIALIVIGAAAFVKSAPYTINWNTTALTTGSESVSLSAKATDADGNVGSSPASTATVNNGPPASGGYSLPRP